MKLLANQLHEFEDEPVEGFLVRADESNIFKWDVWIEGPSDTPYAGGVFKLRLEFPPDFPLNPPTLHFISDFWHPNGLRCFFFPFLSFFSFTTVITPFHSVSIINSVHQREGVHQHSAPAWS